MRGDRLTASQIAVDKVNEPTSRVEAKYNGVVDAFEGQDSKLKTIRYHDGNSGVMKEIHPAAAFIFIGQQPNTAFLNDYLEMDKYGFVLTGHDLTHDAHGSHKPLPFESSVRVCLTPVTRGTAAPSRWPRWSGKAQRAR